MMPGTVKPRYGVATHKSVNLIEQKHMVRPTSGIEMISSRHFPDEVQGDLLINNTIGFLGTKQHIMEDDGTGYKTRHRQDLLRSDDRNFRPVDLEFAPDGSLYLIDWHNILIGHMQHNARDPLRDHVHGRVYRITYPSRPLVTPAKIDGASIDQLLENLKLPEYRTRYRTRRELRARNADEVQSHLQTWITKLDKSDSAYEHHLTEALWVSWGLNRVDKNLVKTLLSAKDFRARAAAVRAIRYNGHQLSDQADLLKRAAADENGRVRLEAIVAASWLDKADGSAVLDVASQKPLDEWMIHAYETARAHLEGREVEEKKEMVGTNELNGVNQTVFAKGKDLYNREGYCATCHMADGSGLGQSGFPPLRQTAYVNGDEERLIKIVLKGLQGPIEVNGIKYPGQVPMTPFEGLLNDEEVAAVLSYVRNSFGNKSGAVSPAKVRAVREKIKNKKDFYNPAELLKEHPLENRKTAAVK
jgi:mono/diheme cytochrome c family protein